MSSGFAVEILKIGSYLANRIQVFYIIYSTAPVSAYVGLISAVQTLEQTHGKSKLYTTCLVDCHLQSKSSHLATPECSKSSTPWVLTRVFIATDGVAVVAMHTFQVELSLQGHGKFKEFNLFGTFLHTWLMGTSTHENRMPD